MANLQIKSYDFSKSPRDQSRYSRRIQPTRWEDMMPFIVAMFREGLTRKVILERLRAEHNFHPSMGQLVHQMTLWHMNRYKVDEVMIPIENSPFCSPGSVLLYPREYVDRDEPFSFVFGPIEHTSSIESPGRLWALRQLENVHFCIHHLLSPQGVGTDIRNFRPVRVPQDNTPIGVSWEFSEVIISTAFRFETANYSFSESPNLTINMQSQSSTERRAFVLALLRYVLTLKDSAVIYDLFTVDLMVSLSLMAIADQQKEEIELHTTSACTMLARIREEYLKRSDRSTDPCMLEGLAQIAMAIRALPVSYKGFGRVFQGNPVMNLDR